MNPEAGLKEYKLDTLEAMLRGYQEKAEPDEYDKSRAKAIAAEIKRRKRKK